MTSAPATTPAQAATALSPSLRFPELQGQRGLAALFIVVFHAYQYDRSGPAGRYPLEGSWAHPLLVGLDGMVDWFFVLSAFLLTLPFARALVEGRPLSSAKDFLGRRAVRIVPLYLIAILVVWVSRNPRLPGEWRDLLGQLTFTQVYDEQRIFYTIGPAWSLAVEVQFYVVMAALAVLLAKVGAGRATARARLTPLVVTIGVLGASSAVWWLVLGVGQDRPASDFPLWFSLVPKLVVFAIGMGAAVLVACRPAPLSAPATVALRVGGLGLVLAAMLLLPVRERGSLDWVFHTLCAVGFGAVVLAGALGPARGVWYRVSSYGPLPWLGMVSYSLYLWHEPLMLHLAGNGLLPGPSPDAFLPTVAVVGVLGLVAAWISYWVIEYPFAHLRFFLGEVPRRELQAERRAAP